MRSLPVRDLEALRLANAGAYTYKREFYQVKDHLLEQYGVPDGYDLQVIEDICYNCNGDGCWRCNKGVWARRTFYLLRFRIGSRVFHKPEWFLPPAYDRQKDLRETIKGRIRHAEIDYRQAQRAAFRLMRKYRPALWLWVHKNRLGRALYPLKIRIVRACRRHWAGLAKPFRRQDLDQEIPF